MSAELVKKFKNLYEKRRIEAMMQLGRNARRDIASKHVGRIERMYFGGYTFANSINKGPGWTLYEGRGVKKVKGAK